MQEKYENLKSILYSQILSEFPEIFQIKFLKFSRRWTKNMVSEGYQERDLVTADTPQILRPLRNILCRRKVRKLDFARFLFSLLLTDKKNLNWSS